MVLFGKDFSFLPGSFPGGRVFGFLVTGMIDWRQKSTPPPKKKIPRASNKTPKKTLGPKFNPKKSHAEFPSHKKFQRSYAAGIRGNYHESSECLEYPQKIPAKIKPSKKYLPKFSYPKKSRNRNFEPQKSFDHPCHLKSGVPPPGGCFSTVLT